MAGDDTSTTPPVALSAMDRGVALEVRVQPGARRNEVVGAHAEALKVRIAAPAVEGRANDELVAFLAKTFGLRRNKVVIRAGSSGRRKRIILLGADLLDVTARVERLVR